MSRSEQRGGQAEPRREWWEVLGARVAQSRLLARLRRVRVVATWVALGVLLVAVVLWPALRTALGAWIGCVWAVVAWFLLARAKTVSWSLVSGVFSAGMMLAPVTAGVSTLLAQEAGVAVGSASASVVIASLAEETLKLVPLAALGLLAPGRVRRLLASDWLVLGVACGAAFTTVEEMARRLAVLGGGRGGLLGLLGTLMCPYDDARALECWGMATYSISPVSGGAGEYVYYAGHGVLTGLVAAGFGTGLVVWRCASRRAGAQRALVRAGGVALAAWWWWVAVVDHMGRNASLLDFWSRTGGEAPWWPVRLTGVVTGHGHGRAAALFIMLAVAWVMDTRTLWASGYTLALEDDDGGGWWGRWRWTTWHRLGRSAWLRLDGSGWRAVAADVVDLVSTTALEGRAMLMTLYEACSTRRPDLLVEVPTRLRLGRQDAAREQLDPPVEQWWRTRLAAACAVALGLLVLFAAVPLTGDLAVELGETGTQWLAGVLESLADLWDSLDWQHRALLLLAAGAIVVLSGGTLGMALNVGMGMASLMASLRGSAAFVRDPRGAVRAYLSTHTPGEIAADVLLWAVTSLAGGALGYIGGQLGRAAYYSYREIRTAHHLWRTDRRAWRLYLAERRHSVREYLRDETGAAAAGGPGGLDYGKHYPGVRTVRHGDTANGPGAWGRGRNHGSPRAQLYEEQVTGVVVQDSYIVGGVEFDGWDGTHLIDAKGLTWEKLLTEDWAVDARRRLYAQARRQVAAVQSTGTPIQWHFAERGAVEYLTLLQEHGRFPAEIELIYTPPA